MIRYQVTRDADGWHVFSHDLTWDSMLHTFPTRRAAITEMQMMRMDEEAANLIAFTACDRDEEA